MDELLVAAQKLDFIEMKFTSYFETQEGYDFKQCLESEGHCKNPICRRQQEFFHEFFCEAMFDLETELPDRSKWPAVLRIIGHDHYPAKYSDGSWVDDYSFSSDEEYHGEYPPIIVDESKPESIGS
ncbi:Oidioi.mRNA.OKI2018_I69.chr1.g1352.t1.cds [Oikopleura dioica]|uniref:Oidioi.mRNA.OKI2018_I69.chr1.g1352.t1.cds n=1 Tax=Oikopleura dioica TaxID=34765 RepID=A0ABN7SN64_OIKDI|nr:Oidioi.mRNA.OKI2018_I69.chr1.g1352.t1.cds [Oikopleura dioica]